MKLWGKLVGAMVGIAALSACEQPQPTRYFGYVEGEYTRVAAPLAGRLVRLDVQRGGQVAAGAPLFALETELETAQRQQAQARLAAAQAQLDNLRKGRRNEELQQLQAALAQARADASLADSRLRRQTQLVEQKFVSAATLDELRSAVERAHARERELAAQIKVAGLGARSDEVSAQQHQVQAAQAELAQTDVRVAQKTVAAPVSARVVDTLYTPGEQVPVGSPVVSLLAPGRVKLRFYVPNAAASSLKLGAVVQARCEQCPAPIQGRVSFIATQPEYTPPVIYSREQRSKLVFLVEATPDAQAAAGLHPGTPVDVELGAAP
jgi:HlyD family secretion protein